MAKKEFGNLEKGENLKGINALFNKEVTEQKVEPDSKEAVEPDHTVKTFNILTADHEFLTKYILYKGFHTGEKYSQKKALNDALNLLREKYPDIEK